jgi:integrase
MARFQNYLLTDRKQRGKVIPGIKPQTINRYIASIRSLFDFFVIDGQVKTNPCKALPALRELEDWKKIRGCYEISKLKGVFNQQWPDQFSYLLCLVIYTTGMRNSEIERIQVKDIVTINNIHFIDIPKSKTRSGVRMVPLHEFVHEKLCAFIRGKSENDCIFKKGKSKKLGSIPYEQANLALAKYTGYSAEQLEKENITFYSGRHFWKTLMNSEDLGDIEEYFMGHKVSSDVAKRYNHRDKQGREKLLEKARKVFAILDKRIFKA